MSFYVEDKIMDIQILMLLATLLTMITGIICAYYACKDYTKQKCGKPQNRCRKHNTSIRCKISTKDNVTVDMKITAQLPASDDGYFRK